MTLDDERFFYRTGRRSGATLAPVADTTLRPALFARVSDLATLRYDFPVVLVDQPGDGRWMEPLSSIIDVVLAEVAPSGFAGERFRRTVLRLEREIRLLLRDGAAGWSSDPVAAGLPTLEDLWSQAHERLTIAGGDPAAAELMTARSALQARHLFEGLVVDCLAGMPADVVGHAWAWVERRKSERMQAKLATLLLTLANLVRADHLRSQAGRGAEALAAGVGAAHRDLFDFGVMARLLAAPSGESGLSPARRHRIDETIDTLRAQRFFGADAYGYRFDGVDAALEAWRERQGAMADLVRAVAVAELEVAGRYNESRHDAYFADFDPSSVGQEERLLFPDYLVTIRPGATDPAGRAMLLEALAGEAPIKILLETDDPFGLGGQLATTAMGLGGVYVLQAPASHLPAVRDQILEAFEFGGPALVSVFNGTFAAGSALPPYLVAAAAIESRTFPAFAYDPGAGPGWVERFRLLGNPQPDRPWPVHDLTYADRTLTRVEETTAFTPIDFALCDPGRARHFAGTPVEHWEGLIPGGDWLNGSAGAGAAPFVPAIDAEGQLLRLAADEALVRDAQRVAQAWSRLVQLDEMKLERVAVTPPSPAGATEASAAAAAPAGEATVEGATTQRTDAAADEAPTPATDAAEASAEPERNPDEPWIETWRCTTCNECTNVNPRMFAYNENRQAFIKDLAAGSYADLVNAAESCQVAIIHPGKPRDPGEPNLDELLERAQPFL